ncbi:MAG: hypothetical protein HN826_05920 [Methylococcales bacterium]|nr:hypothetical protein [Methylococcales bacterium]
MNYKKISYPASYKTTLNQKELIQLAIGFSMSLELHRKYHSCGFSDCAAIAARIIRDNIDRNNITHDMDWDSILSLAEDNENDDRLRRHLLTQSRTIYPEYLFCTGIEVMTDSITEKMGKMLMDLIYENIPGSDPSSGMQHEIEDLRNQYISRVDSSYSRQLNTVNMRTMEDDDHGGSQTYRSISKEGRQLTQSIEDLDLDDCQSIEEVTEQLDLIIKGKIN